MLNEEELLSISNVGWIIVIEIKKIQWTSMIVTEGI